MIRLCQKEKTYLNPSASSSGICHEGFPVALPLEMYNPLIDEITSKGAVVRKLVGKLRFIPEVLASLYSDYTDVPQGSLIFLFCVAYVVRSS